MAFIGAGSASALVDEVVLCKVLVENGQLCPTGSFFPAGTKALSLASKPVLKGTVNVECEDSLSTTTTTTSMAVEPEVSIDIEFGKLPKPELGKGCTGCTEVHTVLYSGKIVVVNNGGKDEWFLLTNGFAELLHCTFFNVTCKFGSNHLKLPIDLDASTHPKLPKVGYKGDLLLIKEAVLENKGSELCGATGKWTASYTTAGCDEPGSAELKDCWLALYPHL